MSATFKNAPEVYVHCSRETKKQPSTLSLTSSNRQRCSILNTLDIDSSRMLNHIANMFAKGDPGKTFE